MSTTNAGNSNIDIASDWILLAALVCFLLYKGFVTFAIEPIAAGTDVRAYLAPITEIFIAVFTITAVRSKRYIATVFSSFFLLVVGGVYWFFFIHAVRSDFDWFVVPNLSVFAIAAVGFFLHPRVAADSTGGSHA